MNVKNILDKQKVFTLILTVLLLLYYINEKF